MTDTPVPAGLKAPGRKLWRATVADFDMTEAEAAQLAEACFCRDRIAELRAQVAADGVMLTSSQGMRLHPGIAEIRQQQLAMARILATVGVAALEEDRDGLPASRGVRGIYISRPA